MRPCVNACASCGYSRTTSYSYTLLTVSVLRPAAGDWCEGFGAERKRSKTMAPVTAKAANPITITQFLLDPIRINNLSIQSILRREALHIVSAADSCGLETSAEAAEPAPQRLSSPTAKRG